MSFDTLISATEKAWSTAREVLDAVPTADGTSTAVFAKALLEAQTKVAIASSVEQKTSAAIDKAFQAHSQVASK